MQLRQRAVTPTAAALAATGLLLAGCSGGSDTASDPDSCQAGTSTTTTALIDDRGVLPADNFVTVVSTKGDFRATLGVLNLASRGLSSQDLSALLGARGKGAEAALKVAVSDVTGKGKGSYRLLVPATDVGAAVGDFYGSALDQVGASAHVSTAVDAAQAVSRVSSGAADAAVIGLVDLASVVKADLPDGGDASAQVQAIATAALRQELALGSTANASRQVQVLVAADVVSGNSLSTLSELAEACSGSTIAPGVGAADAAATLAAAYGFELDDTAVTDPATTLSAGDVTAVAVDPLR